MKDNINSHMLKKEFQRTPGCVIGNLAVVYICYAVCRLAFLFVNWELYKDNLTWQSFSEILYGGWIFDNAAIFYTNSIYLLLVLLPLHYKERKPVRMITKGWFLLSNSLCIVMNLMDAVYFSYTQHRSTAIVFDEFKNETNLATIFGIEVVRHWYLLVVAILLIALLVKLYCDTLNMEKDKPLWKYYVRQTVSLVIIVPIAVCCMRGTFFNTATRPISISNALQYVNRPVETGIVLNTPFAILRTLSKKNIRIPRYFSNSAELDSLYSPVHHPIDSIAAQKKNIVILIVESFAQEFVGALNKHLDNGQYRGYTPFADSLLCHSLYYEESFSNSGFSIDAMPAVLSSIPRMDKPFVLTPFSLNSLSSLPGILKDWGYSTAFFHGAANGSMGFQAYARTAGFSKYYGRTEYNKDSRFNGDKDYDGTWAIWDEPFLQYYCLEMGKMKEPFMTSVFTATSHHPFAIPEQYKDVFKNEGIYPLHKCIRYTDYALRQFFATARQQPWYKNTIFVITADHASSRITHDEYKTDLGIFRIPILFFDPTGEMPAGCHKGIAQQIDIMPTLLGYLGYNKPYIAFGQDLLHTHPADTWAFNWDHIPQFIKSNYLLQSDSEKVTGIYDYHSDPLLKNNLKGKLLEETVMEQQMKALIQGFMERMEADNVTINPEINK